MFMFSYTEIPGWFYSSKWMYYQKVKGRTVCYISRQLGDHWKYKVQLYFRGELGFCDLEYRHSDIDHIVEVADQWLEEFKSGDKVGIAEHYYHPFNEEGYWMNQYPIDKRYGPKS